MGPLPPGRYSVRNATTGLVLAMTGIKVHMTSASDPSTLWDVSEVTKDGLFRTVKNVGTKKFLVVENTDVQGDDDPKKSSHWYIRQQAASKTGYFFALEGSVLYMAAWGPEDVRLELNAGQISQLWVPTLVKPA